MRAALYVSLIVLNALLSMLAMATATETRSSPRAEMKQLTLADVNQAMEQQDQVKPAVRLVRQLGFGRRFVGGGFGPGAAFGGGGFGSGGGFLGRRRFLNNRRFANPGFFQHLLEFFG